MYLGDTEIANILSNCYNDGNVEEKLKVRLYRDTIPGHVLSTNDETDMQRMDFYNKPNWQQIYYRYKTRGNIAGGTGSILRHYQKSEMFWDNDPVRGAGEFIQNAQMFELDLNKKGSKGDIVFQEDISVERVKDSMQLAEDFGVFIPVIEKAYSKDSDDEDSDDEDIYDWKKDKTLTQKVFTEDGQDKHLRITEVMERILHYLCGLANEYKGKIDKFPYPDFLQSDTVEFYFTSCLPFNETIDLKTGPQRLASYETAKGEKKYMKAELPMDDWFVFFIQMIKRIRIFHRGKEKIHNL